MRHKTIWFLSCLVAMLIAHVGPAHAQSQTPGQITKFDPSLNVVDSVITEDGSGNIGIGTTTPVAGLDVANGDLNLAGNILKGGVLFLHNAGDGNTFLGLNAGNLTMNGAGNIAIGTGALQNNTTGGNNAASGASALQNNTTGSYNTASGVTALYSNCSSATPCSPSQGGYNTASGASALQNNTTGSFNTASGVNALLYNTTGTNNTAIGYFANISVGNLTNATAIGHTAVVNASNKIRLGNTAVEVIEGQVPYTFTSDRNQKENFQPVDGEQVLRRIGGLNLTSWNYIGHDPQKLRHYGPVAQDFFAAFGHDPVGTIGTDTTINSGDMEGILMIAVQALEKRTSELATLKAENADLKARLEKLERSVTSSAAKAE